MEAKQSTEHVKTFSDYLSQKTNLTFVSIPRWVLLLFVFLKFLGGQDDILGVIFFDGLVLGWMYLSYRDQSVLTRILFVAIACSALVLIALLNRVPAPQ